MIAIDANVAVRFLVADDVRQFNRAKRIFETQQIFVPTSVLLETEWVSRDKYESAKPAVRAALRDLLNLPIVALRSILPTILP